MCTQNYIVYTCNHSKPTNKETCSNPHPRRCGFGMRLAPPAYLWVPQKCDGCRRESERLWRLKRQVEGLRKEEGRKCESMGLEIGEGERIHVNCGDGDRDGVDKGEKIMDVDKKEVESPVVETQGKREQRIREGSLRELDTMRRDEARRRRRAERREERVVGERWTKNERERFLEEEFEKGERLEVMGRGEWKEEIRDDLQRNTDDDVGLGGKEDGERGGFGGGLGIFFGM